MPGVVRRCIPHPLHRGGQCDVLAHRGRQHVCALGCEQNGLWPQVLVDREDALARVADGTQFRDLEAGQCFQERRLARSTRSRDRSDRGWAECMRDAVDDSAVRDHDSQVDDLQAVGGTRRRNGECFTGREGGFVQGSGEPDCSSASSRDVVEAVPEPQGRCHDCEAEENSGGQRRCIPAISDGIGDRERRRRLHEGNRDGRGVATSRTRSCIPRVNRAVDSA